jgi:glycosyltransferase involved in cell wall biosynthesis
LVVPVLYLAHCTESKGLFDALAAVAAANAHPVVQGRFEFHLTVAGAFVTAGERARFDVLLAQPAFAGKVKYAGFVSGAEKADLLRSNDFLCFPTFYEAEGQPVNLIEALAFGLPPVVTRWRGIPDLLPADYAGLVPPHEPQQVAAALLRMLSVDVFEGLRARFACEYTEGRHLEALHHALSMLSESQRDGRAAA